MRKLSRSCIVPYCTSYSRLNRQLWVNNAPVQRNLYIPNVELITHRFIGECMSTSEKSQEQLTKELRSISSLLNSLHFDFAIGLGSGEMGIRSVAHH